MSDTVVGRIEFGGAVSKEDRERVAKALFDNPGKLAAVHPEPPPRPNASKPVWEAVIEDMQARDRFGREKYGTPLQCLNGRDPLVDAYQECLDMAVYLKQAILERAAR